jgi:hypothetical protein
MENIISYINKNKDTIISPNCSKITDIKCFIDKISSYEWYVNIDILYENPIGNIFKTTIQSFVIKQNKFMFKHNCNYYPFIHLNDFRAIEITNDIIDIINNSN